MLAVNRKLIFDAVRLLREGQSFTREEVAILDRAINDAMAQLQAQSAVATAPCAPQGRKVPAKAIALMHSFEQCRLDAYPDPGSKDGHPWTIGWGSTGEGIKKGVRWTQAECDARFADDLNKFAQGVERLIGGAPTTDNQFGAMVSLAYNIGLNALRHSTVLRKHKAGDHAGAARAFLMWNKNDKKVMRGLTRRRLAEADLYDDI